MSPPSLVRCAVIGLAIGFVGLAASRTEAQELDQRVREAAAAGADAVSFRFDTWPEVEHCSGGWTRRASGEHTRRNRDCWSGPAEVRLDLRGDVILDIDTEIVREGSTPDDRWQSLGTVTPEAAVDFLLDLAGGSDADVGKDALGAATLADGVETWPRMLELAQDPMLDRDIRSGATFWVGQASADQVLDGLRDLIDDPDGKVRQAALFALSEHQGEEAVPLLMEIAEGDADPGLRRAAFFWLSQKEDPRVLPFFERVLRSGGA